MGKYKVGDVAALFSKPKDPATEGGKKLQSLFQDFYGKKGKSIFRPSQHKETPDLDRKKESKETEDQKMSKKNRKRKYSAVNESETNDESINSFKKIKQAEDTEDRKSFKANQNKRVNQFSKQRDFPRKKNKGPKVNGFNSNNSFPKFEEKFDSEKVFGGYTSKEDNQDSKFNFIKKSKRQSLESGNDSFSHNQNKLSEDISEKDLVDNSFDSFKAKKGKKNKKQNINFVKKSKQNSLESVGGSFNQNELPDEVSNRGSADNSLGEFKPKKGQQNKKQNLNALKKLKYQKVEPESYSHNKNKLPNETPDDGDISLKSEIQEFMKHNSKKFKNNDSDCGPKSPPKVFNQRKNLTYTFKQKAEQNVQSSIANPSVTEIQNNAPARQVADFIRNPRKKNKANNSVKPESLQKPDETSNKETTNDSDTLFKTENEDDGNELVFKKKKFSHNYTKDKTRALTAGLPEPDFIKLPNEKDDERLSRTLFVGNLPVSTSRKSLHKLFAVFGNIEQIRFHGVETNKAKIFSETSQKLLNANYAADSLPGFIVFIERENAIKALSLNGTIFKDHHIIVDFAMRPGAKKIYDEKKSIFIGNLPFTTKDDTIWNVFSQCGKVESVRVIRDKATGIGKGFGYVLFDTEESRKAALALENVEIEGRTIRIKAVESNAKSQKNSNSPVVKRNSFKSRAIRLKKNNKDPSSRKSVNQIMKKQKNIHNKKKIASILQKSMK